MSTLFVEYERNYDQIAADHLAHYRQTGQNPWIPEADWQKWEDATAALIQTHAPTGPMLDCGVGLGRLLSRFPDRERHGIDIAGEYLEEAAKHGINVKKARMESLPFATNQFAAVICTDILEHVLDLNRCVTEALRVLKRGGYLFVRTPNQEDLAPYLTQPYRFVHLRRFDEPTHRLLFERVFSCEVVACERVGIEINVVVRKP